MHTLFCRHIWAELSLLFYLNISERNFFPGGGGGGVHVHPVHPPPPAYAPEKICVVRVYSNKTVNTNPDEHHLSSTIYGMQ